MDSIPRVFLCNTCSIKFETSEAQRAHMREAWHIYNLRRRVVELPAVSKEEFTSQTTRQDVPRIQIDNDSDEAQQQRTPRDDVEHIPRSESEGAVETEPMDASKIPPTQCLFCNLASPSLATNLSHMSSTHGLFIPSPQHIPSLASFLGYLATIIFTYHECLYCSAAKGSVAGVQTHMRDKGHCMIQMHEGSELLDFWDLSSGSEAESEDGGEHLGTKSPAVKLSHTERKLPSGNVIYSRGDAPQLRSKPGVAHAKRRGEERRGKREEKRAIAAAESETGQQGEEDTSSARTQETRVAVRGEMGLLGLSESQKRALQAAEKKMERRAAVAKAAYRYAMEQQPVKTKYYKTENPVYQAG